MTTSFSSPAPRPSPLKGEGVRTASALTGDQVPETSDIRLQIENNLNPENLLNEVLPCTSRHQ
jgi:hypothetical protein